jgi:hypothetical protein
VETVATTALPPEMVVAWYAGTRARATLAQAEELRRVLVGMGAQVSEEGKSKDQSIVRISSLNSGTRGEVQLSR